MWQKKHLIRDTAQDLYGKDDGIVDGEMQEFDLLLRSTKGLPTLNLDGQ